MQQEEFYFYAFQTKALMLYLYQMSIMNILPSILILSALRIFCSCNPSSTNKTETIQQHTMSADSVVSNELKPAEELIPDTATRLRFNEFSVTFNRLVVYEEDRSTAIRNTDSVQIGAEMGETIEGQLLRISDSQLTGLKVEQRYETSITIMNEGPHCDLTEWKHFYSEWNTLKLNNKGQFICDSYTEADYTKFPDVAIEDLQRAAKEHCGRDWFKLIESIKSPNEYPSAVWISRYQLRITGQHKDNGKPVTKFITINVPMGC